MDQNSLLMGHLKERIRDCGDAMEESVSRATKRQYRYALDAYQDVVKFLDVHSPETPQNAPATTISDRDSVVASLIYGLLVISNRTDDQIYKVLRSRGISVSSIEARRVRGYLVKSGHAKKVLDVMTPAGRVPLWGVTLKPLPLKLM